MALDKDFFLPAAFKKVQKIYKGLEVMESAKRVGKDWKDYACMNVSLFTILSQCFLARKSRYVYNKYIIAYHVKISFLITFFFCPFKHAAIL